jgi:hypothetical protein
MSDGAEAINVVNVLPEAHRGRLDKGITLPFRFAGASRSLYLFTENATDESHRRFWRMLSSKTGLRPTAALAFSPFASDVRRVPHEPCDAASLSILPSRFARPLCRVRRRIDFSLAC